MVSNGRPELLEKSFQLDHLEEVKVVPDPLANLTVVSG